MRKEALILSFLFGLGFGIGQLVAMPSTGVVSNELIFSMILLGLARGYAFFAGLGVLIKHLHKNILQINSDEEVGVILVGATATIIMAVLF